MVTVLLVVGILLLLIIAHELGHFIVAKFFKVRVEEFGIGYPPRAFTFGHWGKTEYTINWLPFGGFVRLLGEHGETREKGAFTSAPKYAQAAILIAGVAMNALMAWLLFAGALHSGVPRVLPEGAVLSGQNRYLLANTVVDNSPAFAAGLRAGDEIVRIQDVTSGAQADLRPNDIVAFISERGGKRIEIDYVREGVVNTVTVTPAHAVVGESAGRPAIGLGLVLMSDEKLGWFRALWEAIPMCYQALQDAARGLWAFIADAVSGRPNLQNIVGPVGLVDFVGNASRHGLGQVLLLAGFISINLSVINLVPIPALDGGRLFLLGIEAIMRRPPNKLAVQALNIFGILSIVILMVAVTYNDIVRLLA